MGSSEQTRELVPVFVEKAEGQDIRNLLYIRDEKGGYKSLAEVQSMSEEYSTEIPGILTTSIIETTSAERGTTIATLTASPSRICCVYIGGYKVCYAC